METSVSTLERRRRVNQGVFDRPYMDRSTAKGKLLQAGAEAIAQHAT
jgi:hypothetical protein